MAVIAAFAAITGEDKQLIKDTIRRELRRSGPPVIYGSRPADCHDRAWNELHRTLLTGLLQVASSTVARDPLIYRIEWGTLRWMRVSEMRGKTVCGVRIDETFDSLRAPSIHPVARVQALAAEIYNSQMSDRQALLAILHQIPELANGQPEGVQRAVSRHINRLLQVLNVYVDCQTCGHPSLTHYHGYGKRDLLGSITLKHATSTGGGWVHKPNWKLPLTLSPRHPWLGPPMQG